MSDCNRETQYVGVTNPLWTILVNVLNIHNKYPNVPKHQPE